MYFLFFIYLFDIYLGMDQYLLIPFLGGWTSIYQLFWCELQGYKVSTHCHLTRERSNPHSNWWFSHPIPPWAARLAGHTFTGHAQEGPSSPFLQGLQATHGFFSPILERQDLLVEIPWKILKIPWFLAQFTWEIWGKTFWMIVILKVGRRQLHSRKPEAGNCLEIAKLTKFRSHCTAGVFQKCSVLSVLLS